MTKHGSEQDPSGRVMWAVADRAMGGPKLRAGLAYAGGPENAGHENAGPEIDGPIMQDMKLQDMQRQSRKLAQTSESE